MYAIIKTDLKGNVVVAHTRSDQHKANLLALEIISEVQPGVSSPGSILECLREHGVYQTTEGDVVTVIETLTNGSSN